MKGLKKLSKNELYFLKLFVHNYSYEQIGGFLKIKQERVFNLENSIQKKFNTVNHCDTIIRAFDLNILSKYDYVKNTVKKEALVYAYKIYNEYLEGNNLKLNLVQKHLEDFLKDCKTKVKMENLESKKGANMFNAQEISYIKMKYKGFEIEEIANYLRVSKTAIIAKESYILNKLNVNSWYNAYRKAFELELLREIKYKKRILLSMLLKHSKNIFKMVNLKKQGQKMKLSNIYYELVSFYVAIEYDRLHSCA